MSHRARRSCSPRQNVPWRLVGLHREPEGAARPGRTYPGGQWDFTESQKELLAQAERTLEVSGLSQSQKELLAQAERTLEVSGVSLRARRSCSPRQNIPWRLVGCHTEPEGAARPGRRYPGGQWGVTQSQKELLAQAERTLEVSGVSHRARRSCSPRQNVPWRSVGCHTEPEGAARPGRTYPGG